MPLTSKPRNCRMPTTASTAPAATRRRRKVSSRSGWRCRRPPAPGPRRGPRRTGGCDRPPAPRPLDRPDRRGDVAGGHRSGEPVHRPPHRLEAGGHAPRGSSRAWNHHHAAAMPTSIDGRPAPPSGPTTRPDGIAVSRMMNTVSTVTASPGSARPVPARSARAGTRRTGPARRTGRGRREHRRHGDVGAHRRARAETGQVVSGAALPHGHVGQGSARPRLLADRDRFVGRIPEPYQLVEVVEVVELVDRQAVGSLVWPSPVSPSPVSPSPVWPSPVSPSPVSPSPVSPSPRRRLEA